VQHVIQSVEVSDTATPVLLDAITRKLDAVPRSALACSARRGVG
jgi:hypothetical protein